MAAAEGHAQGASSVMRLQTRPCSADRRGKRRSVLFRLATRIQQTVFGLIWCPGGALLEALHLQRASQKDAQGTTTHDDIKLH